MEQKTENPGTLVALDIDLIPESLYDALLAEFIRQHGEACFVDWCITASKEGLSDGR